ncbi:Uncharacterized protein Fot_56555 [Forsythia ovata]|uniref:Uncharacterized protein n=1 Tax=Forsythia ovata TaxID=205694 RepID=A0ABD1NZV3_9LAMI
MDGGRAGWLPFPIESCFGGGDEAKEIQFTVPLIACITITHIYRFLWRLLVYLFERTIHSCLFLLLVPFGADAYIISPATTNSSLLLFLLTLLSQYSETSYSGFPKWRAAFIQPVVL